MSTKDWVSFFEQGFPLDEPKIILPWNKPLEEVANSTGGVWYKDRYVWKGVHYLNGLDYVLCSRNGMNSSHPFQSISAYIGLTDKGWSDKVALQEYSKVAQHLVELFGEPQQRQANLEIPNTETLTWQFGKIVVYLNMIEQHVYKCYLTILLKEKFDSVQ